MRTSWSFVAQARKHDNEVGGVLWFSQYQPSAGGYSPIFSSAVEVPKSFSRGTLFEFSQESSYWAFCAVGNYAQTAWSYIHPYIAKKQNEVESELFEKVELATDKAKKMVEEKESNGKVAEYLTSVSLEVGEFVFTTWKALLFELIGLVHDGYQTGVTEPTETSPTAIKMTEFFYPRWWLVLTDYFSNSVEAKDWTPPTNSWESVENVFGAVEFSKSVAERVSLARTIWDDGTTLNNVGEQQGGGVITACLLLAAGVCVGYFFGAKSSKTPQVYQQLP